MHPACSHQGRKPRERGTRVDGRSTEIQRLIGRTLRSVVDFEAFPDQTAWIDCDVLQADGGTRTAAINGAYVALCEAMNKLDRKRAIRAWPLTAQLSAVSVGVVKGECLLDLDYREDSKAEVDMNLVMTDPGHFLELQGTGEKEPFTTDQLHTMIEFAESGIEHIRETQSQVVERPAFLMSSEPSEPLELVVASMNPKKKAELAAMLDSVPVRVLSGADVDGAPRRGRGRRDLRAQRDQEGTRVGPGSRPLGSGRRLRPVRRRAFRSTWGLLRTLRLGRCRWQADRRTEQRQAAARTRRDSQTCARGTHTSSASWPSAIPWVACASSRWAL